MAKTDKFEKKSIKDFIYVDGERLHSFYSQIFEGVAETIIKSKLHSESQKGFQKGIPLVGERAEEELAEVTQSTENTVLYDHMFERLETKLNPAIVDASAINQKNFREELQNIFLMKVNGKAELIDFERLKEILKNFNKLGEGLAYFTAINELSGITPTEAQKLVSNMKNSSEKQELQKIVSQYKDIKEFAKSRGLHREDKQNEFLNFVAEVFYHDAFEVVISPVMKDGITYRGVINKKWLRIEPNLLRQLFCGYTSFDFTMIGQVTFLPPEKEVKKLIEQNASDKSDDKAKVLESVENNNDQQEKSSSMRDSFVNMQKALRGFERVFIERDEIVEVVVQPLAIYRESIFAVS